MSLFRDGREMEVISTPVNWSHVEGVMPMIKVCTCKWLQHLADKYTLQVHGLLLWWGGGGHQNIDF